MKTKKTITRQVSNAERFFNRSPFSVVTMVARIKGTVEQTTLTNAVKKVQMRHPLLQSKIVEGENHTLWFSTEDVEEIPVKIIPRVSKNDWLAIHTEETKVPFDFDSRPAIRFVLVQSKEESELIILCHHIICDGLSLGYLVRDLMAHLGDPNLQVEELPMAPVVDENNLPDDISVSGIVKFFIKRMNSKWEENHEYFTNNDYLAINQAYWSNYSHEVEPIELGEEETQNLVKKCKETGVSVNTALTTAITGAQGLVEGNKPYHPKLVVAASLRDRLPKNPGEGMGFYAGDVEMNFKYNQKKSLWQNARSFQKKFAPKTANKTVFGNILNWVYLDPTIFEAMNFKKLGSLVPSTSPNYKKLASFSKKEDVVMRILKRDNLHTLKNKHWGAAVTNLGRMDIPSEYGELKLDRVILQPGGGIPLVNVNLVLGAVTCAGKLSVVLEYAPQAISGAKIKEIKAKFLELLLT